MPREANSENFRGHDDRTSRADAPRQPFRIVWATPRNQLLLRRNQTDQSIDINRPSGNIQSELLGVHAEVITDSQISSSASFTE